MPPPNVPAPPGSSATLPDIEQQKADLDKLAELAREYGQAAKQAFDPAAAKVITLWQDQIVAKYEQMKKVATEAAALHEAGLPEVQAVSPLAPLDQLREQAAELGRLNRAAGELGDALRHALDPATAAELRAEQQKLLDQYDRLRKTSPAAAALHQAQLPQAEAAPTPFANLSRSAVEMARLRDEALRLGQAAQHAFDPGVAANLKAMQADLLAQYQRMREEAPEAAALLDAKLKPATSSLQKLTDAARQFAAVGTAAFVGVSAAVVSLSAVADPAVFRLFTFEARNLSAAFGQLLVPILQKLTDLFRSVNGWVSGLSPQTKQLATALVAAAGAAGGVAFVLSRLGGLLGGAWTGVVNLAKGLLGVLPSSLAAVLGLEGVTAAEGEATAAASLLDIATGGILPLIGAVATLAVGAGVGLAMLGGSAGGLGEAFAGLRDAFAPVLEQIGTLASAAFDLAGTLAAALGDAFGELLAAAKPVLDVLAAGFRVLMETITRAVVALSVLVERLRTGRLFAGGFFAEVEERFGKLSRGGSYTVAPGLAHTQDLGEASRKLQEASIGAGLTKMMGLEEKKKTPGESIFEWLKAADGLEKVLKAALKATGRAAVQAAGESNTARGFAIAGPVGAGVGAISDFFGG